MTENLYAALAEYTEQDRNVKPQGRDIDEAVAKVRDLLTVIGAANYLRDPLSPGNQVEEGEPALGDRFRKAASLLARPGSVGRTCRTWAKRSSRGCGSSVTRTSRSRRYATWSSRKCGT